MRKKKELKVLISIMMMLVLSVGGLSKGELARAQESIEATAQVGQVDINSASIEDLQKISGIGAVLAQRIVASRPYASLDELSNVKGIGAATLKKIKDQGLAYADADPVLGTISEVFPEKNLASEIAVILDKEVTSQVTTDELSGIKKLNYLINITDFEGIQYLTNLQYLSIDVEEVKDFSKITSLKNLETLYLSISKLESLAGVENFTNLKKLHLRSTGNLKDISEVYQLQTLEDFTYRGSAQKGDTLNLEGAERLTKLKKFELYSSEVSDLQPIYNLSNIEKI